MADISKVKDRVQAFLASEFRTELTEQGGFTIRNGSSRLFLHLLQKEPDPQATVWLQFLVPVLQGVAPSDDLFRYVALHGSEYIVGALTGVGNDDGSIDLYFKHSLMGDYLDQEELTSTVAMMLGTTDDLDDELQQKFGGTRFHEDS